MKRLLVLVLVAACSSGSAKVASGVSKADYLKKAEAVCAKANKEQNALKTPTEVKALAPYVSKVVAIADEASAGISALEAPKADKEEIDAKVLAPLKAQLVLGHDYADKVAAAAKADDQGALVQLLTHPPTDTKADLVWMKRYGFKECVDAADTST